MLTYFRNELSQFKINFKTYLSKFFFCFDKSKTQLSLCVRKLCVLRHQFLVTKINGELCARFITKCVGVNNEIPRTQTRRSNLHCWRSDRTGDMSLLLQHIQTTKLKQNNYTTDLELKKNIICGK